MYARRLVYQRPRVRRQFSRAEWAAPIAVRTEAHRPAGLTAAPRLPPPPPPRWQVLSVNGEFSSARSITPGATLALPGADGRMTSLAVEAVTKKTGGIVNPVTVSGTLLAAADGAPVLASAYPGAPSVAYVHIRIVASYVCIHAQYEEPRSREGGKERGRKGGT